MAHPLASPAGGASAVPNERARHSGEVGWRRGQYRLAGVRRWSDARRLISRGWRRNLREQSLQGGLAPLGIVLSGRAYIRLPTGAEYRQLLRYGLASVSRGTRAATGRHTGATRARGWARTRSRTRKVCCTMSMIAGHVATTVLDGGLAARAKRPAASAAGSSCPPRGRMRRTPRRSRERSGASFVGAQVTANPRRRRSSRWNSILRMPLWSPRIWPRAISR